MWSTTETSRTVRAVHSSGALAWRRQPHSPGDWRADERPRALAQTGKTRIAALPDIPTATEIGLAGIESYAWWGVFTTGGTPKPIIERFSVALAETLREPAIQKQLSENLQITLRLGGPEEQATFLSEQMKLWGPVVREHGIKGD